MALPTRKRDLLYLIFFLTHLPIMFCVDLYPLYPPSLRPEFLTTLRTYYIATYRDDLFTAPPPWFHLYMWLELVYHVPVSVWAVGALWRDDPKVPMHLLVWAVQTAVTTATCVAEVLSWEGHSAAEKGELGKLYGPYLMLAVFMGVDMYMRLNATLSRRSIDTRTTKKAN